MNVHRYLAAILLLFAWSAGHAATTQYYYDDLGRIVQAVRSDGAVFQYQYDANGNVLAINRICACERFDRGAHAAQSGRRARLSRSRARASARRRRRTPSTFSGGALGTVTSASPTTLKVTVPQAAQSGLISVTVSGNTATSAMSYTVRRPAITKLRAACRQRRWHGDDHRRQLQPRAGQHVRQHRRRDGFDHLDLEYTGRVRSRRGLDSRRRSGRHALRFGRQCDVAAHDAEWSRRRKCRRGECLAG